MCFLRRGYGTDRVVRPCAPCHCEERSDAAIRSQRGAAALVGRRGRRPLQNDRGTGQDAVPYEIAGVRCKTGGQSRPPLRTLSLRGAKRRGNPFPARRCRADGTPYPKGICSAALHCRTPSPTRGSTYRPVGRGPCAPPPGTHFSAEHMGPALQGAAVIRGGRLRKKETA